MFGGTGRDGSSVSDSGGAMGTSDCAVGAGRVAGEVAVASLVVNTGSRVGSAGSGPVV